MRCPKMDELPVFTEWQTKIYCPNCKHYSTGQCSNPARKDDTTPCPLINVEPIEIKNEFNFKIHQKVYIKPQNVNGEIVNRQLSTIGVLYEIKTDDNRFWITEDHLE
jgi:hypothetical protein